jgi:hypothetical protein
VLFVLVSWPVSQACLHTAAVLVLVMKFLNFYYGHCLLLLLASVKYLVKNFLTEYVGFSYPALSVVASLIICLHVFFPVTI